MYFDDMSILFMTFAPVNESQMSFDPGREKFI